MIYIALLRNVNLGQPKSPTREQLEAAFLHAGASSANSFMSNGTLVFGAAEDRAAQDPAVQDGAAHKIAKAACQTLAQICDMHEPAFIRRLQDMVALVDSNPFARQTDPSIAEQSISFFDAATTVKVDLPIISMRNDCKVFQIEAGNALSVAWTINGKTGYPTPVLEATLGVPVTTRGWNTLLRLVKKHGHLGATRTV